MLYSSFNAIGGAGFLSERIKFFGSGNAASGFSHAVERSPKHFYLREDWHQHSSTCDNNINDPCIYSGRRSRRGPLHQRTLARARGLIHDLLAEVRLP